jgi:hypothetical protein
MGRPRISGKATPDYETPTLGDYDTVAAVLNALIAKGLLDAGKVPKFRVGVVLHVVSLRELRAALNVA